MPSISVIVPVYKAEAFLHACVDSILSQTFSDFEVILVDDGSPDRSGEICDDYARKDGRVSVIHQENSGQAAARNRALGQAEGQWICFVDSDDVIHPKMLEALYGAVFNTGAGISMCRYVEAPQLPEDFYGEQDGPFELLDVNEETLVRLYDREEYPAWVACTKLVRRDLVEGYPFREGRVFEDNEAVCRWVCGAGKLASTKARLYYYRTNLSSTTKSTFSLKKLDYLWAMESILKFYSSLGYLRMRQRFFDRYAEAVVSACYGLRYTLDKPERVKDIAKDFRRVLREEKLRMTPKQLDDYMDAAHPKLAKVYWPLAGIRRTVKEAGVSGIVRKITKAQKER